MTDKKRLSGEPITQAPRKVEQEELVHYDDAVIGRAFRWSLILFLVLGGGAALGVYVVNRKPAPAPAKVTTIFAPVFPPQGSAQIPQAKFTDVTGAAGIRFIHNNGAYGEKLLPETMGGGVAFFDADKDGDPDLLFVNSTYWPGHVPPGKQPGTHALYLNDGTGRFSDGTAGSGLDQSCYGMGVAVGDYDNDGLEDVFITAVGPNHLYRNLGGGKFADVTAAAGVAGAANEWSTSAAWMDFDRDGDLDLFVANYVRWSKAIDFEVGYTLVGVGRAYGQPMNFEGTYPYLYRNDGQGRFTDVSAQSGIQIRNPATGLPLAKSLGLAPVDVDNDGWMDLVVANDTVQNFLFHNQRDGSFKEVGAISGIAFDTYGNARGAMGIDSAYYRNDETLGIAIGNFANEMTALYASQGKPFPFTDEAIAEGIGPASRLLLKFGLFFFDYDLDGRLDLLTANGHLEEEIHKIQQSQQYAQPAQLFWNAGPGQASGFYSVPAEKCGTDLLKPIVGRGSAFADMDGDGDLDVVMTQVGGPPLVLRNDQNLGHAWVRLKLLGKKTNRDAVGGTVKLRVDDQTLMRHVMPTRSYLSQSELPISIGLGKTSQLTDVEILWPSGTVQKVSAGALRANSLTLVEEIDPNN